MVPVTAAPAESPPIELDEYSGLQTPTDAGEDRRGQDVSAFCISVSLLDLKHSLR